MNCGVKFAKCILIFFNVIFFLTGAALAAIGLWVRFDEEIWDRLDVFSSINEDDPLLEYGAYLLIAVGFFILITGFLGCCGALKENKCMLGLYIFILVIVMLAEIAAGAIILIYREDIEEEVIDQLRDDLQTKYNYTNDEWSTLAITMNFIQKEFECCGVESYREYDTVKVGGVNSGGDDDESDTMPANVMCTYDGGLYPATCFKPKNSDAEDKKPEDLVCGEVNTNTIYGQGCDEELQDFFERWAIVLVAIALGFACLQIFGLVFAVCLCRVGGKGE